MVVGSGCGEVTCAHLDAEHEDDAEQLSPREVVKALAHRHLQLKSLCSRPSPTVDERTV